NRAASALLIKALAPEIAGLDLPATERRRILAFAASNEHLFLNVGMAACKAGLDAAHKVPESTLVTAMARNGTEFGIRVSGLGESTAYRLPPLDFRGTPTGIDVRLVVQTGILPQIDTGMAHREPGIGQVGAGLVKPPRVCFDLAFEALVRARAGAADVSRRPPGAS